jgi:hypothetical protein
VTDWLIRLTTALAVLMVASVAAVVSYQHACELVKTHGETGFTARLLPFTVDGLIWAASMFSGVLQPVARRCTPRCAESFCNTSAWVVLVVAADLPPAVAGQAASHSSCGVTIRVEPLADLLEPSRRQVRPGLDH